MIFLTSDILFFIREEFINIFQFMRETVVFEPSIYLFDFPITIFDILIGFFTADMFLFFFDFLDDYDDIDILD